MLLRTASLMRDVRGVSNVLDVDIFCGWRQIWAAGEEMRDDG